MATIALVDDDQNILTSVSIALEAEGYSTSSYTDGASALDGINAAPPDLVILDIKMPRMDGMETWPAPGSEDTKLGVFMGPEVSDGEAKIYARVQA